MTNWNDLPQVKKGKIGEQLVRQWLENNGWVIYRPQTSGAHPFDNLCATKDKKTLMIAEVKTKPARSYYPDTGIDEKALTGYLDIQRKHNLNVFIFFVDEKAKKIYGGELNKLNDEFMIFHGGRFLNYPRKETDQRGTRTVYFPLSRMTQIANIDDDSVSQITRWSTRNPDYD